MINLSHQEETIYQAARQCANDAMGLSDVVASKHAVTYFQQQRPAMSLEDVVKIFRQAFAEKREEEAELDSYDEE